LKGYSNDHTLVKENNALIPAMDKENYF